MREKATTWAIKAFALLSLFAPQAHAGYVWFVLNNANVPGMQVTVAEQIVCITPGNCGAGNPNRVLDYQFYVFNTGAFPVDGFSIGVGNRASAIGGGEDYSDLAGGADGVFPAATGAGVSNAIAFLTQPGVDPALVTSQAPGEAATAFIAGGGSADINGGGANSWGFEEFDNFSAGGVPANKAYVARWYTALQGGAGRPQLYNNGCTGPIPTANVPGTPLANGAPGAAGVANDGVINTAVVCNGVPYFADVRFDLFSANGPVAGTGAPDPGSTWDLGFDDDVNGTDMTADDAENPDDFTICDANCSAPPTDQDLESDTPEPGAEALIGGGLILLVSLRRRLKRPA